VEKTKALVQSERAFLIEGLLRRGMKVFGSRANFIFFKAGTETLASDLKKRGILIRSCKNFRGLSKNFYRIAVRTRKENETLLAAVDEISRED